MTKDRLPADNPTTAIFDLAEQMSSNYKKIIYLKYYAYLFVGITIIFLVAITIALLAQGNVAMGVILFAVIVSGLMLLRLIIFTINFLEDFNTNFQAIKMVREIDPLPQIPQGKTPIARLESYLRAHDPAMKEELSKGAQVNKNYQLGNGTWPLVIHRRARFMGPGNFLALAMYYKSEPKMADFINLEKDMEQVGKNSNTPTRVIVLYKAPANYNGISDDLYSYLTDKEHFVLKSGRKHKIKLQLFVEHSGRYEIIPLLP